MFAHPMLHGQLKPWCDNKPRKFALYEIHFAEERISEKNDQEKRFIEKFRKEPTLADGISSTSSYNTNYPIYYKYCNFDFYDRGNIDGDSTLFTEAIYSLCG